MKKIKLIDGNEYLVKIDKPKSIRHEKHQVVIYYEGHECFNLNPSIGFQEISECTLIDEINNHKYLINRANAQRLVALKNAFKIVDAFEIPSMNPEDDENYEKIKKELISNYSENVDESEINKYIL